MAQAAAKMNKIKKDFARLLKIAPHGDAFVDALTQVTLQFPDEMSPDELSQYKAYLKEFREKLGVTSQSAGMFPFHVHPT